MEATGLMSNIPDGMYTRGQVADKIGRTRDTIKRWHDSGTYKATHWHQSGKTTVWLYTDEDVAAMKQIARTIKSGPKKETH